jgi:hypothetical protein
MTINDELFSLILVIRIPDNNNCAIITSSNSGSDDIISKDFKACIVNTDVRFTNVLFHHTGIRCYHCALSSFFSQKGTSR